MKILPKKLMVMGLAASTLFGAGGCASNEATPVYGVPQVENNEEADVYGPPVEDWDNDVTDDAVDDEVSDDDVTDETVDDESVEDTDATKDADSSGDETDSFGGGKLILEPDINMQPLIYGPPEAFE